MTIATSRLLHYTMSLYVDLDPLAREYLKISHTKARLRVYGDVAERRMEGLRHAD